MLELRTERRTLTTPEGNTAFFFFTVALVDGFLKVAIAENTPKEFITGERVEQLKPQLQPILNEMLWR